MLNIPRVRSMISPRGTIVPNQFVIYCNDKNIFQSYNSIIAVKYHDGRVELGINWDYSRTTGKYRNEFLGEGIADTRKKIVDGVYTVNEEL